MRMLFYNKVIFDVYSMLNTYAYAQYDKCDRRAEIHRPWKSTRPQARSRVRTPRVVIAKKTLTTVTSFCVVSNRTFFALLCLFFSDTPRNGGDTSVTVVTSNFWTPGS